ncbi:MAG: hypothetical protein HUJ58_05525, partial [Erysipelotrichaceae bacterium]|nr:hypothetical protein [Erysipelotrichaceae bacterium]
MGLWLVSTARFAWIMALCGLWLFIKGKASVKWCVVFLVGAVWIGLWKFNTVSAKPIIGIVWEHKENSYLVNNGVQTVWVMNKEKPPLDSIVEVVGPVKEFHSMENGLQGTLERYAQSHHIAGYTYAKSTVISEVHTLRKLFYSHLSDLQNEFITEMIAGRTDSESTVGSILISSGMHVSYVLSVMTSLLGLFLDEKKVKGCRAGYLLLAGILYRHKFFWYRLVIQEIASYITRDRKQKFNIQWMILICLFPCMTTEYAFVIPFLFGFLAVYGKK